MDVNFGRFYLGKCRNANGKTELLGLADKAGASETPQVEQKSARARQSEQGDVKEEGIGLLAMPDD